MFTVAVLPRGRCVYIVFVPESSRAQAVSCVCVGGGGGKAATGSISVAFLSFKVEREQEWDFMCACTQGRCFLVAWKHLDHSRAV